MSSAQLNAWPAEPCGLRTSSTGFKLATEPPPWSSKLLRSGPEYLSVAYLIASAAFPDSFRHHAHWLKRMAPTTSRRVLSRMRADCPRWLTLRQSSFERRTRCSHFELGPTGCKTFRQPRLVAMSDTVILPLTTGFDMVLRPPLNSRTQ